MTEDWFTTTENIIFTKFAAILEDKYLSAYPNLNVTNSSKDSSKAQFPTVYFESLSSFEKGNTLENYEINVVEYTVQIKVITEEEMVAKEIANFVKLLMKEWLFDITVSPLAANTPDTYVMVARYRREFTSGDKV